MLKAYCKNTGTYKEFKEGTTLLDMIPSFDFERPYDILSAIVNNVCEGLKFRIYSPRDIKFLDYRDYNGRNTYCRSLCFLLCKASEDVFPGSRMILRRPISKGYYCTLIKKDGSSLVEGDIELIRQRMEELVRLNVPFKRHEVQTKEAIETFRKRGAMDKVKLLESCDDLYITYYSLGETPDYFYESLVPSTGYLKIWQLMSFQKGILLRVPDRHHPEQLAPMHEQLKTFGVIAESAKWNSLMGLENVGDVNKACMEGKAQNLIQVAEALQAKKIVQIAEQITQRYDEGRGVKIVLITGPTSSGKSTFSKRLSVQLMACGLHPISFSTDDYFVNRLDTPKLPDGSYDFDNFETVDHDALQKDVEALIEGKTVSVPEYNFITGIRENNGKTLKLDEGKILIIEGIHALNPLLTSNIDKSRKFKIFINAITSISLDDHNCIPTSDNRLLRRIVRDFKKGAYSAQETISNWPNVRRAEVKWIYPYQEEADALFNSTYLVEFAVFRSHAEAILRTVPKNCKEYTDAHRLLHFLHYFLPVSDTEIPKTSLIRSFIGKDD